MDFGIIPIENSLFGSIIQNYDLLREYNLIIVGEIFLRVKMNLMSLPNVKLSEIRNVYSHPQALGQTDKFLRTLKNIKIHPFYDTAGAAKMIFEEKKIDSAAVASTQAAEHYQLNILKRNIETDDENFTRFVIISKNKIPSVGKSKTSLIFATKHVTGSLQNCLVAFSNRKLNLLKIESRPYVGHPWQYLFFVDIENDRNNFKIDQAIKELKNNTTYLKNIGSYKIGKVIK